MEPAAVLAVVVKARGIVPTNAQLKSVHGNLTKAEAAGAAFGSTMQKSSSRAASAGAAMSGAGRAINRNVGIPVAAIGLLSAKAAVDFEDSFADMRKTVDATEPQLAKLETGARRLSKHIPISVHELNKLGGMAGALGIKRKALLPFIKTAAELGTTTDMSSEEAANALARISNVMGTSEKDFRRLGSTFVDLGNKGASTEQEIANMGLRIVGAGKQVGLSESEVLGFASALASVGVRAEAGGSAISKVFSEMAVNVANGSKKVQEFGSVAGMSGDEFANLFKANAGEAMIKFIEGLDKIRKEGGNVYGVLEDLELKDIRIRDSLLRAAGAGKLFREQLKVGSAEWRQNNALSQEAAKRYGTTASEISLAKNEIYDFAITLGQNLLPIIADVLGMLSHVAAFFSLLPTDVQVTILKLGALVIVLGLLLSLGGKLVTAYSLLPKLLGFVTGATAAQTVATQAAAVANAELAASLHAAAMGQRELLLANKSGAVVGSVPIGAPTAATTVAASTGARATAISWAKGIGRFLPWAFAAAGVMNIMSDLMSGKSDRALVGAGMAAAGAIAGGLVFGLPGALVGAGIGAFGPDLLDMIFGGSDAQRRVINYFQRAKQSLDTLGVSTRHIGQMQKRQKTVSGELKEAENSLAGVREKFGPNSSRVLEAEAEVIQKRRTLKKLNREIGEQEKQRHGPERQAAEIGLKKDVPKLAGQQARLMAKRDEERWQLGNVIANYKAGLAGYDLVRKKQRELAEVNDRLRKKTRQLGEVYQEASRKISPKFSNELQKLANKSRRLSREKNPIAKWFDTKIRAPRIAEVIAKELSKAKRLTKGDIEDLVKTVNSFPKGSRGAIRNTIAQMLQEWASGNPKLERKVASLFRTLQETKGWRNQQDGAKRTKREFENTQKSVGKFRNDLHTKMGLASGDVREFAKTSSKGLGRVAGQLTTFAGQLGLSDKSFTISGKNEKTAKAQTGGMVVPGSGTGDKVPLTALVEPGEVVHVLNSRASKDRQKLQNLEMWNTSVPRFPTRTSTAGFQKGGLMGPFNVDGALPGFVPFMNFLNSMYGPIYVMSGLRPGSTTTSGNVSNHASGHAVDISTTQGGLNMSTSEATLNATGAAAKRMDMLHGYMSKNIGLPGDFLWRTYTGGNHFNHIHRGITSAHASNPALMSAYLSTLPKGEAFGGLKKLAFEGPDGALKEIGQDVMNKAVKWGNEWLSKQMSTAQFATGPGAMGSLHAFGPDLEVKNPGPFGAYNHPYPEHKYPTTSGFTRFPEGLVSSMASWAGLPGRTFGQIAHGESNFYPGIWNTDPNGYSSGRGLWAITSGVGNDAMINSFGGEPAMFNPLVNAGAAKEIYQGAGNSISPWYGTKYVTGQTGGAFSLNFQGGGKGKGSKDGGKKAPSLQASVKNVLKGIAQGKHLPKYNAQLKKLGRRIAGIGVSEKRIERLGDTTKDIEKYAEYASNASSMTTQDEDGNITQGLFKGRNEGAWLNDQLGSLVQVRRELIGVHGSISGKQLPRVNKLLKDSRERLKHVKRAIREAEEKKRELEKKAKEIEQAQNKSKQALEKEINELENKINKAQGAKNPNKAYIEQLRGEVRTRRDGISNSDKKAHQEIKDIGEKVRDINHDNQGRKRVESALTGTIIPGFEGQRTGMYETMASMMGDGGESNNVAFTGLKTVQGAGGPLEEIPNPPPYGMLGGEIFNVQNRLQMIKEEAERTPTSGASETDTELLAIANEMAMEWKKRYIVSQAQMSTLTNFPTVQQVATSPFAGSFAKGGVLMAEVGEKGREIIAAPQGSRVIPKHEATAALSGSGGTNLNFEEFNLFEDGSVAGKINGEDFQSHFKKTAKRVGGRPRTPGGKR